MDFKKLLSGYVDEITIRQWDDFAVFSVPVYFMGTMESMAISVREIESGFVFSDCHRTVDYWEELDLDTTQYEEKIEKIRDSFNIERRGNEFIMTAQSECETVLMNMFGYFLQGIIMLANVAIVK